ncbi:hypothetical protein Bbelb_232920 [Branchiostoma belcheri]|nr:hypothetical protein Bbelb_232920 [Branchiostoma belcheri]
MQTTKEKAVREVEHQDQNTAECGVTLPINSGHDETQAKTPIGQEVDHQYPNTSECRTAPKDCIEPSTEVPIPPNTGHDDNQAETSVKSPVYRKRMNRDTTNYEDSKLMAKLYAYGQKEDIQKSAGQTKVKSTDDTGQVQTEILSRLYDDKTDDKEAKVDPVEDTGQEEPTTVSQVYGREDNVSQKESGHYGGSEDGQDQDQRNLLYTAQGDSGYEAAPPQQESTGPSAPEQDDVFCDHKLRFML